MKRIIFFLGAFFSFFLQSKIHRLNMEDSSLYNFRFGYVCNFDDKTGEVICYKVSITDPDLFEKVIIASKDGAYELCGLVPGDGLIGTFQKSNKEVEFEKNSKVERSDHICSVWFKEKHIVKKNRVEKK